MSTLLNNTESLQNAIQALQNKAAGGSTQTCSVTLTTGGPSAYGAYNIYYIDGNGVLQTETCGDFEFGVIINPAVNSIVVVSGATTIVVEGEVTRLSNDACLCSSACDIWVDY